jgi:uncharacterized damage-inducible protein DinB
MRNGLCAILAKSSGKNKPADLEDRQRLLHRRHRCRCRPYNDRLEKKGLAKEVGRTMNAIELIQRLHQHRVWVNSNLLSAATSLSDEQLRSAFQIGQGSIWKSLVHLYAAEYVWLEALLGNEAFVVPGDLPGKIPGNQQGEGGVTDLADLRQKWSALDQRWNGYLANLTTEALEELVNRKGGMGRFSTYRSDVLLHVCTHAHYTVAQVVNMLRHLGVEKLPDTMLISLARQEAK